MAIVEDIALAGAISVPALCAADHTAAVALLVAQKPGSLIAFVRTV